MREKLSYTASASGEFIAGTGAAAPSSQAAHSHLINFVCTCALLTCPTHPLKNRYVLEQKRRMNTKLRAAKKEDQLLLNEVIEQEEVSCAPAAPVIAAHSVLRASHVLSHYITLLSYEHHTAHRPFKSESNSSMRIRRSFGAKSSMAASAEPCPTSAASGQLHCSL